MPRQGENAAEVELPHRARFLYVTYFAMGRTGQKVNLAELGVPGFDPGFDQDKKLLRPLQHLCGLR